MELCLSRTISNLRHDKFFTENNSHLRSRTSLRFNQPSIRRTNPGFLYYTNLSLRSSSSEEASSGPTQYVGEERGVATLEDLQPVEKNSYAETVQKEEPEENSSMDWQAPALGILDNIDIKFDSEDTYSILLFGGVALIALWLATAVVGAIDSIPLFPKLMEVVGLPYTLWFTTRYLLFKENRAELFAKIEDIKQQVIGSNDD